MAMSATLCNASATRRRGHTPGGGGGGDGEGRNTNDDNDGDDDGGRCEAAGQDAVWNRVFLRARSRPAESIFGLGHQYTYVDTKGLRVPVTSG